MTDMWDFTITGFDLTAEHVEALEWFDRHRGLVVSWSELQKHADGGARLVNQAKGIYKPAYADYALSVRQTLESPYADLEMVHRSDGSWVYPYFQENRDPAQRDGEATNRGLVKCMADGVPVGVLLQTKPKPGVQYQIAGLARVIDWRNGYFFLEGFDDAGDISTQSGNSDVAFDRANAETLLPVQHDFDPSKAQDERIRTISEVVHRRGQAKFRKALLEAYDRKCAVTECNAIEALEAAHITPYLGEHTNHPQNGILFRADIHTLFDLGLLSVDPHTLTVVLAESLLHTSYGTLHGTVLRSTRAVDLMPSKAALAEHLKWSGLHNDQPNN